MQDFSLVLVGFQKIPVSPFLLPVYVPLLSSVTRILYKHALHHLLQVIDVDVKQDTSQDRPRTKEITRHKGSATGRHEDLFPLFLVQGLVTPFALLQIHSIDTKSFTLLIWLHRIMWCDPPNYSASLEQQCPIPVHSVQKWNCPEFQINFLCILGETFHQQLDREHICLTNEGTQ